jgi:hypothetical protein
MTAELQPDCPHLETCPIFKYFRSSAKKAYLRMYCQGDFETCERFQLRAAGQPVPPNLLPHGGTLWDVVTPTS